MRLLNSSLLIVLSTSIAAYGAGEQGFTVENNTKIPVKVTAGWHKKSPQMHTINPGERYQFTIKVAGKFKRGEYWWRDFDYFILSTQEGDTRVDVKSPQFVAYWNLVLSNQAPYEWKLFNTNPHGGLPPFKSGTFK